MPRFVALLRGVNAGNGKRMSMTAFRAELEALAYGGVQTVLAGGNGLFTHTGRNSTTHAGRIRQRLWDRLALDALVIVKSAREFQSVLDDNPFMHTADPARLLTVFAQEPSHLQAMETLRASLLPGERLALGRQAAYLDCAEGIASSRAAGQLLDKFGRGFAIRHWAAVQRIGAALADP